MTREELNREIKKVLTTQFKKDAKEAHKAVEEAGYTIYKEDGSFGVQNKATGRWVRFSFGEYSTKITYTGNWYGVRCNRNVERDFDFVGQLEKPINKEWREAKNLVYCPTQVKYEELMSKRWNVKYHADEIRLIQEKRIKELQRQMEELQRSLIYHVENRAKDQQALDQYRKELGLVKR